jgi:hypothetical protein
MGVGGSNPLMPTVIRQEKRQVRVENADLPFLF